MARMIDMPPDQYSLLRGRRYNRTKRSVPNPSGVNHRSEVKGQNDPQPKTAEKLAIQHGVSPKTIKRDGQFAEAVEKVKAVDPKIEANGLGPTA